MSEDEELIKPKRILVSKPLDVGGIEGPKHKFTTYIPESAEDGESGEAPFYVLKEFESEEKAREVVKKFNKLRKLEFPVPEVTIYHKHDGKHTVLMTDLTEGGKYRVWGLSAYQTDAEYDTIRAMNPDISELKDIMVPVAKKLNDNSIWAYRDVWAIRRSKDGGKLEPFLLDMAGLEIDSEHKLSESEVDIFLMHLERSLWVNKKAS